uniref:FERM domain-containing protein n=1 Tax=Macrostomum lignano TaxID=282301 RepID=A0A1I8IXL6_9PLAT
QLSLEQRKPAAPASSSASSSANNEPSSAAMIKEIDKKCESYCKAVYAVAERYLKHMPIAQRTDMRRLFNTWKDAPDKLDVSFMYKLSGWRAVYTLNLFRSRIQTVWLSLRQLMSPKSGIADQLTEIFGRTQRVHRLRSGPCVAAMLIVLRECFGITQYVKLIGIDQFIGWGPYVVSMNGVEAAGPSGVEFWHERVEEATIDKLPNANVAIMSYTDAAVHTPKFWETMRLKFAFILVLDQRKGALSRELQRQGFCHFEYEFKGSKRVFYYINPFGEMLKLAHCTASTTAAGSGVPRLATADSDDSDAYDSDSSSDTSSSTSGDDADAVENDEHIEQQVAGVMQHLLAKVEQQMSLGLARTRTRDRRRAMQEAAAARSAAEDDEVTPELERAITQRLLAAVDTMNSSGGDGGADSDDAIELHAEQDEASNPDELMATPESENQQKQQEQQDESSCSRGRGTAVRKRPQQQKPQPSQIPASAAPTPISSAESDEEQQANSSPKQAPPHAQEKVLSVHMPDWARDLIANWSTGDVADSPPASSPTAELPAPQEIGAPLPFGIKRVASQPANVRPLMPAQVRVKAVQSASPGVTGSTSGISSRFPGAAGPNSGRKTQVPQVRTQVPQVRTQCAGSNSGAAGSNSGAAGSNSGRRFELRCRRFELRCAGSNSGATGSTPDTTGSTSDSTGSNSDTPRFDLRHHRFDLRHHRFDLRHTQLRPQAPQVQTQAPQVRPQAPQVRPQAPQVQTQAPQVQPESAQSSSSSAFPVVQKAPLVRRQQLQQLTASQEASAIRPVGIARPALHETGVAMQLPQLPQSSLPDLQPAAPVAAYYPQLAGQSVAQQQPVGFQQPQAAFPAPMYAAPVPGAPYCYVMPSQPQFIQQQPTVASLSTTAAVSVAGQSAVQYMPAVQFLAHPAQQQQFIPMEASASRMVVAPNAPAEQQQQQKLSKKRKHEQKSKKAKSSAEKKKKEKKKKKKSSKRGHRRSAQKEKRRRRHRRRRSSGHSSSYSSDYSDSEDYSDSTSMSDDVDKQLAGAAPQVEEFVSEDSDLDLLDYRKNRTLAEEEAARLREPVSPTRTPSPPPPTVTRKKIRINRDIITID